MTNAVNTIKYNNNNNKMQMDLNNTTRKGRYVCLCISDKGENEMKLTSKISFPDIGFTWRVWYAYLKDFI